jgi:hypothetical protein
MKNIDLVLRNRTMVFEFRENHKMREKLMGWWAGGSTSP